MHHQKDQHSIVHLIWTGPGPAREFGCVLQGDFGLLGITIGGLAKTARLAEHLYSLLYPLDHQLISSVVLVNKNQN